MQGATLRTQRKISQISQIQKWTTVEINVQIAQSDYQLSLQNTGSLVQYQPDSMQLLVDIFCFWLIEQGKDDCCKSNTDGVQLIF